MCPALHSGDGGDGAASSATERPSAESCGSAEEEMKYLWLPSSAGYEVRGKRFHFFMALIYTSHTGRGERAGGRERGGRGRGGREKKFVFPPDA